MEAKKEYMDLASYAVDQAKKAGADAAEAYILDSESVNITVSNKAAEQVNAVKDKGIGIRILKDEKMVFGSTNNLARDTIKDLVSDLMKKVTFHTQDEFNVIPGKDEDFLAKEWASYSDLISYDKKIAQVAIEEKIKNAIRLETSGLEFSPKVTGSMMIIYQDGTDYIYLANSNGITGWYPTSGCGGWVYFSAAEGKDQQSGNYAKAVVNYDDFDPEEIGKKGAENAVRMLGAKPIESCEIPLVISPDVGTQILRYIVGMLSADRVPRLPLACLM
jgi:PmbA protein